MGQMIRQKLGHLAITGMMEGKQPEKMLNGSTKWLKIGQVTEALRVKKNRDARKFILAYAKEPGT